MIIVTKWWNIYCDVTMHAFIFELWYIQVCKLWNLHNVTMTIFHHLLPLCININELKLCFQIFTFELFLVCTCEVSFYLPNLKSVRITTGCDFMSQNIDQNVFDKPWFPWSQLVRTRLRQCIPARGLLLLAPSDCLRSQ